MASGMLDGEVFADTTYVVGKLSLGLDRRSSNNPKFPALTFHIPSTVQAVQTQDTMASGMLEGEVLAGSERTGGKLGVGLVVGVLTGLIGTGIGYFVIEPAPMSAEAIQRQLNKSPEYQMGFKSGWEKKTQSKKRNAFLAGGLLGTVAFVALLVSSQSQ